jgi:hypothetical protein
MRRIRQRIVKSPVSRKGDRIGAVGDRPGVNLGRMYPQTALAVAEEMCFWL